MGVGDEYNIYANGVAIGQYDLGTVHTVQCSIPQCADVANGVAIVQYDLGTVHTVRCSIEHCADVANGLAIVQYDLGTVHTVSTEMLCWLTIQYVCRWGVHWSIRSR